MTFDHPDLGTVVVSPMHAGELPMVMSHWMASSHWHRRAMTAVIERGTVFVARDAEGLALGWLAMDGSGRVAHAYCKSGYRANGLCRALWEAAGKPTQLADDVVRRASRVLAHLMGETT